jgi:hypothetical protein
MKNEKLIIAAKSSIDDGALRLLIYSYGKNVPVCALNYIKTCNELNISPRSFYRYKKVLLKKPELFITVDDLEKSNNNNQLNKLFEEFYNAYPRKMGRGRALKSFTSAVKKGTDPNVLIDASKKFNVFHEEKQTDKQYIPYPATWLNAEGWEDETISNITDSTSTKNDLAPNVL